MATDDDFANLTPGRMRGIGSGITADRPGTVTYAELPAIAARLRT